MSVVKKLGKWLLITLAAILLLILLVLATIGLLFDHLVEGVVADGGLRATPDTVLRGSADGLADGTPAVAVFSPSAVAVYPEPPKGSPRNVVEVVVAALEPRGDVVRLRASAGPGAEWADGLAADVTAAAVVDLALEPGVRVHFAVKATEVGIHPAGPVSARS